MTAPYLQCVAPLHRDEIQDICSKLARRSPKNRLAAWRYTFTGTCSVFRLFRPATPPPKPKNTRVHVSTEDELARDRPLGVVPDRHTPTPTVRVSYTARIPHVDPEGPGGTHLPCPLSPRVAPQRTRPVPSRHPTADLDFQRAAAVAVNLRPGVPRVATPPACSVRCPGKPFLAHSMAFADIARTTGTAQCICTERCPSMARLTACRGTGRAILQTQDLHVQVFLTLAPRT